MNKAKIPQIPKPFLDLHLSIAFFSSKIFNKRDDFDFKTVNFPFLDGDVPRRSSYGVYISQLIRFARICNHVTDFNAQNKYISAKLDLSPPTLAFVAGLYRATDDGSLPEIAQYSPYYLPLNVLLLPKDQTFFLFAITAAGVVPCALKYLPVHHP